MLAQSYNAMEAGVITSRFENRRAGRGCFAIVDFGKRMMLRNCSRTLMYTSFDDHNDSARRYVKGVMYMRGSSCGHITCTLAVK